MAPAAQNTIQMDNLVDNLTAEELSRPEEGELQTQSLKRSRYNDIREIPASDDEEGGLQPPLSKKAKVEGVSANDVQKIPAYDDGEEYEEEQEEAELQSHFPKKAEIEGIPAYLDSIPEPTIPERLARMGSISLPVPTTYNACTFLPADTRKSRTLHHDISTMHDFQIDMKAVIEMIRMEIQAYNLVIIRSRARAKSGILL
jgi:hypothetical protein